jgi:hypothetical protein
MRGPKSSLRKELVAVAFLLTMLVCVLVVSVGACVHSRWGGWVGLVVVWISTGVLMFGAILAGFSIGLLLVPAALLGVLAGVIGLLRMEPPR